MQLLVAVSVPGPEREGLQPELEYSVVAPLPLVAKLAVTGSEVMQSAVLEYSERSLAVMESEVHKPVLAEGLVLKPAAAEQLSGLENIPDVIPFGKEQILVSES